MVCPLPGGSPRKRGGGAPGRARRLTKAFKQHRARPVTPSAPSGHLPGREDSINLGDVSASSPHGLVDRVLALLLGKLAEGPVEGGDEGLVVDGGGEERGELLRVVEHLVRHLLAGA